MTDKQTIEYVRPEGLPKDAVPYVGFVGPMDVADGSFPVFYPTGATRTHLTTDHLHQRGYPVPERTYEVTVRLTEAEVKARASDFQGVPDIANPYVLATKKYNNACRAAIEAGEA